MKHFISLLDYTNEELTEILNRADYMHDAWRENRMPRSLVNKKLGLWFYGNGFRNRLAFELGAQSMGAQITYIPGELGVNEPLEDIGHYLENWYSMLVIRANRHDDLTYMAENLSIPVVNARTDFSHPCEIMGDLQFARKYRGSLEGLEVIFVGEVTNLCMSWFEAAARFPISVTQIAPKGYEAENDALKKLKDGAIGRIEVTDDITAINNKTDILYTDCWPWSNNKSGEDDIKEIFLPYQLTSEILEKLSDKAMFLPCPPVTRGQEVSAAAMNSPLCLNYQAKEFLLHSQNAIMEMLSV